MSYDLYFVKKAHGSVSETQIRTYLDQNVVNNASKIDDQWFWNNPDTGVYFSIQYYIHEDDEAIGAAQEALPLFEGYVNTNFVFNLNYLRPQFFGLEAFGFIAQFIQKNELYIVNPQAGGAPTQPDSDTLFENWNENNMASCINYFDDNDMVYCPAEVSNTVWAYNYGIKSIRNKLDIKLAVPKVIFYKKLEEQEIIRVAHWEQGTPSLLPVCDYFMLVKTKRRWFRTIKKYGLISYSAALAAFSQYLTDDESSESKIYGDEAVKKAQPLFAKTKFEQSLESFCELMPLEHLSNALPATRRPEL